jgi:hypothetical protein
MRANLVEIDCRARAVLVGAVLGDGYLRQNSQRAGYTSLKIRHGAKQEAYIHFKGELISTFLQKIVRVIPFVNSGYLGFRFEVGHRYFRFLRERLYPEGVKSVTREVLNWLTPEGIAIWYMDDGSLSAKRRAGKIHAHELHLATYTSPEQNQIIIDFFRETYGICFTKRVNKGLYTLRCGTQEAKKFCELIREYVHPSMAYKLL